MTSLKTISIVLLSSLSLPLYSGSEKAKKQQYSKEKIATTTAITQALSKKAESPAKEINHETKDSVAAKLAESKLAIEHARAEHAQNQLDGTREMVEAFKEELDRVKKELETTTRLLTQERAEAQMLKHILEATKSELTKTQEVLSRT